MSTQDYDDDEAQKLYAKFVGVINAHGAETSARTVNADAILMGLSKFLGQMLSGMDEALAIEQMHKVITWTGLAREGCRNHAPAMMVQHEVLPAREDFN